MHKKILLVNPICSAAYLHNKFKEHKIYTVAIYTITTNNLSNYSRVDRTWFDKQLQVYEHNLLAEIEELLSGFDFDFILNGLDEGFSIFETICNLIMPHLTNDINKLHYRTNKYTIQEILKANNIPHIKQIKIERNNFNEDSIQEIGYPCFIKPVDGAASVGVKICNSYTEILNGINHCQTSYVGSRVNEFIVQDIVYGQEISLDMFSSNGNHYVSSVQTTIKEIINSIPCYRYQHLITDKNLWERAVAFVKPILDTCGFKNGFTHIELFYLDDGTFKLIEINPRISGSVGLGNELAQISGLPTQIDLLNQHIHNLPIIEANPNKIHGYGYILYLYNFMERPNHEIDLSPADFPAIQHIIKIGIAGELPKPIKSLSNVDCMVMLYHKNQDQVLNTMESIFNLEERGILI